MSTNTDMIAGAGLLAMLKGVQRDNVEEKSQQAELARQEGLMRLRTRIADENAASGWVYKDTGKPIKQNDLASVPMGKRATLTDHAIDANQQAYKAERKMLEGEREELLQGKIDMQSQKDAGLLERKRFELGMEARENAAKDAKDAAKEAKKDAKAAAKEAKDDARYKADKLFKNAQQKDKYMPEYNEYVEMLPSETPPKPIDEWLSEKHPDMAQILNTKKDPKKAPDGINTSALLELAKRKREQNSNMGSTVSSNPTPQPSNTSPGLLNQDQQKRPLSIEEKMSIAVNKMTPDQRKTYANLPKEAKFRFLKKLAEKQ